MHFHKLAATILLLTTPVAARAAMQDFIVVNGTGYEIESIYVGETGTKVLGNDVIGRDKLRDGERANITFDSSMNVCSYDLVVRFKNATQATWDNLDLCKTTKVWLLLDKQSNITFARIR